MSDNRLSKLLRGLGIKAVPHGFRSSFRDWCGESGQSRELAEAALAHTIQNKAEAAYARTDLLERRRRLMEVWSGCLGRRWQWSATGSVTGLGAVPSRAQPRVAPKDGELVFEVRR